MIGIKHRRQPGFPDRLMRERVSGLGRAQPSPLGAIHARSRLWRRVGLILNLSAFALWVATICFGPPVAIAFLLGLASPHLGWVDFDYWRVFGLALVAEILGVWAIAGMKGGL